MLVEEKAGDSSNFAGSGVVCNSRLFCFLSYFLCFVLCRFSTSNTFVVPLFL